MKPSLGIRSKDTVWLIDSERAGAGDMPVRFCPVMLAGLCVQPQKTSSEGRHMRNRFRSVVTLSMIVGFVALIFSAFGQSVSAAPANRTQVVLLGTGLPRPDPKRSGPATAIVVDGKPYLVDAGPGIVRRAASAYDQGVKALAVTNLKTLFITHLHSDHTLGYPDLIFTTWVQGRRGQISAYGPPGLETMTKYIMLAWQVDIDVREKGLEQKNPDNLRVDAHDVKPGLVYEDSAVKVTAFPVAHGELDAYHLPHEAGRIERQGQKYKRNACQGCEVRYRFQAGRSTRFEPFNGMPLACRSEQEDVEAIMATSWRTK